MEMRYAPFAFLFLMIAASSVLSGGDKENTPDKIRRLEAELSRIQGESADISAEEIGKASRWIEDAKDSFNSENSERTNLLMQKASYQIEFLNALAKELNAKKNIDEMRESLQKIRNQVEGIKNTNAQVIQEINRLEQK